MSRLDDEVEGRAKKGNVVEFQPPDDWLRNQPPPQGVMPQEHTHAGFKFRSASEMVANPVQVPWLIKHWIQEKTLNELFGEPGSCKSLLVLDWAFCIAGGIDWRGFKTKQAPVFILAGEGNAGYPKRIKALEYKYQTPAPKELFISLKPAQLLNHENAQLIASEIRALSIQFGLLVVDTLHRNSNLDENSAKEFGLFIQNLDLFLHPMGCSTLIVHHPGHSDKTRGRGTTAIRGAVDAEFGIKKDGKSVVLSCHKGKDFEPYKPLAFNLVQVDTGWLDDDNEPITSVYLKDGEDLPTTREALNRNELKIYNALVSLVCSTGANPPEEIINEIAPLDLAGVLVIESETWKKAAYDLGFMAEKSDDARRKYYVRAKERLILKNYVMESMGYAWLVPTTD